MFSTYRQKQKIYLDRVDDLNLTTKKREEYRSIHENLRKRRLSEFQEGFNIITNKLKENYQMITLGKNACLYLVVWKMIQKSLYIGPVATRVIFFLSVREFTS